MLVQFDRIGRLYHSGQRILQRMTVRTRLFTEESRHRAQEAMTGGDRPTGHGQRRLNRLTLRSLLGGPEGRQRAGEAAEEGRVAVQGVVQSMASSVLRSLTAPVAWTDDVLGHRLAFLGRTRKRLSDLAYELEHPAEMGPGAGPTRPYEAAEQEVIRSSAVPAGGVGETGAAVTRGPMVTGQPLPTVPERRRVYDRRKFTRPGSGRRASDRASELVSTMRARLEQAGPPSPAPTRAEAAPPPEPVREIIATPIATVEVQHPPGELRERSVTGPAQASLAEILEAKERPLAIKNYDQLNVHKILDALRKVKPEDIPPLLAHEKVNKNRRSVIDTMERIMVRGRTPLA